MSATLQREHWNGQPTSVICFASTKVRGDKRLVAVGQLWTHALGWEVRLEINGDLQTLGGVPLAGGRAHRR